MAPEILCRQPYGLKCDIWSLGCLLHLLLTKKYPFWDEDEEIQGAITCLKHLDFDNDQLYSRMSAKSRNLLQIMLAKEEQERATID